MLSSGARVLLVLTALAPVALIYAVARASKDVELSVTFAALAVLLSTVCMLLMRLAHQHGARELVQLKAAKSASKDVVSFLITYALPVVTPTDGDRSLLALLLFLVLVGIVLFRQEIVHINPLLAVVGYQFYEAVSSSDDTAILITRRRHRTLPGPTTIIKLSDALWLEVP